MEGERNIKDESMILPCFKHLQVNDLEFPLIPGFLVCCPVDNLAFCLLFVQVFVCGY